MAILQFVDSIATTPGLRLDINDQVNYFMHENPDFSPPALKRVEVASMLRDGAEIPITAYDNRTIRLVLNVKGTGGTPKDDMGARLQNLVRELDRPNNILKWKATGAGAGKEVFFRTLRSPDFDFNFGLPEARTDALNECEVSLTIIAEPFAIGLRVTGNPITVNNDPAAATNPCQFDVTGVTGDVATPALIQIDPSPVTSLLFETLLATRRHGTPGGVYIFQAEAMTQENDTTVQANDPIMSGAGNNYSRTFDNVGDNNTMVTRLSTTSFPAVASVDIRGRYRIFVSLRPSVGTPNINVRLLAGTFLSNKVAVSGAVRGWYDMGLVAVPSGFRDPVTEGMNNVAQVPEPLDLQLQAERTSGVATLDWDVMIAVPADEELCIVSAVNVHTPNAEVVLDGPKEAAYQRRTATGELYGKLGTSLSLIGTIPMLTPGQTNRIAFILNTVSTTSDADNKTWTAAVTVSFWPLFLDVVRS